MKFFSGFGFCNESDLFVDILDRSDFVVAGFSLGAIMAIKHSLDQTKRVDKLQLISPAFFQEEGEKFRRLQLINFKKDRSSYLESFYKNVAYPENLDLTHYKCKPKFSDLELLFSYRYNKIDLKSIVDRGVIIEVYLGGMDRIIDIKKIERFFENFATIYTYKSRGHIVYG